MEAAKATTLRPSSLRWRSLREALLRHRSFSNTKSCDETGMSVSRRASNGFNMIPFHPVDHSEALTHQTDNASTTDSDACFCYTLPIEGAPKLYLIQRADQGAFLKDFEVCNRYDIDNTGLVCQWPSEDILAYFCMSHAENMFRSKKVIELGSGYGLAGLVVGAASDALEVVLSDGNPQVVDYIQRNIDLNSKVVGCTKMKSMTLHWNTEHTSSFAGTFDIIIASDCTFFKEFHKGLVQTVKLLLKDGSSEALFFSPNRGGTLNKFLNEVKESGMHFSVTENYDSEVWKLHEDFTNGNPLWPNYEKDHCYPILIRITL